MNLAASWPPPPTTLTFRWEDPRTMWRSLSLLAGYGPPIAYTDVDELGWE